MAELYHISEDPLERRNLIADPEYAKVLALMEQELILAMAAVGLDQTNDIMPIDEGIKEALPDQKVR
jgi:N-acetylglucosamine-6-sulfatase